MFAHIWYCVPHLLMGVIIKMNNIWRKGWAVLTQRTLSLTCRRWYLRQGFSRAGGRRPAGLRVFRRRQNKTWSRCQEDPCVRILYSKEIKPLSVIVWIKCFVFILWQKVNVSLVVTGIWKSKPRSDHREAEGTVPRLWGDLG